MKKLVFFLLFSLYSFSQDVLKEKKEAIFFEEKIEGLSKHTESLEEAPPFIYVIDKETIKTYNFRTLDEVIRFAVPGFFIHNEREYSYIGSRGLFTFDDYNTK